MVGCATFATPSPARPARCATSAWNWSPDARRNQVRKVVHTSTLAVNSDTEEQAVDAAYRVTGAHRSAYDRTTAEAHDVDLAFTAQGLPGAF